MRHVTKIAICDRCGREQDVLGSVMGEDLALPVGWSATSHYATVRSKTLGVLPSNIAVDLCDICVKALGKWMKEGRPK